MGPVVKVIVEPGVRSPAYAQTPLPSPSQDVELLVVYLFVYKSSCLLVFVRVMGGGPSPWRCCLKHGGSVDQFWTSGSHVCHICSISDIFSYVGLLLLLSGCQQHRFCGLVRWSVCSGQCSFWQSVCMCVCREFECVLWDWSVVCFHGIFVWFSTVTHIRDAWPTFGCLTQMHKALKWKYRLARTHTHTQIVLSYSSFI